MVAMPTTRFSLIDGRSSQSASSWAGVSAHTGNCLVNFYYYEQTAQGAYKCRTVAAEQTGDGKCTINAVGKVYTGNEQLLVFYTSFCYMNVIQKLSRNTELTLGY